MPLFLNAEPASTGTSFSAIVERRNEARSSSDVKLIAVEIFVQDGVVVLGDVLDHFFAMLFVEASWLSAEHLQRRGDVRARIHERRIPQLFDIKNFKFRAQRFFQPDNGAFSSMKSMMPMKLSSRPRGNCSGTG